MFLETEAGVITARTPSERRHLSQPKWQHDLSFPDTMLSHSVTFAISCHRRLSSSIVIGQASRRLLSDPSCSDHALHSPCMQMLGNAWALYVSTPRSAAHSVKSFLSRKADSVGCYSLGWTGRQAKQSENASERGCWYLQATLGLSRLSHGRPEYLWLVLHKPQGDRAVVSPEPCGELRVRLEWAPTPLRKADTEQGIGCAPPTQPRVVFPNGPGMMFTLQDSWRLAGAAGPGE